MVRLSESPTEHLPHIILDGRNSKWVLYVFGPFLSLPSVPINMFQNSLFGSVILTIILSIFYNAFLGLISFKNPLLDTFFTSMVGDPLLWGGIICFITSVLTIKTSRIVRGAEYWSTFVTALLPFILYTLVWLIGDHIIKPAFSVDRPPLRSPEPPITAFVAQILGISKESPFSNSMPSGFVMRQVAVFYFLNWVIFNKRRNNTLSKIVKAVVFLINLFALLLVCFSRVYISAHTFLDVSVAIGVGTILFWFLTMPLYSLIRVRGHSVSRVYLSSIMAAVILLFITVFGFAGDFAALTTLVIYCIIVLGIMYIISPVVELINIKWVKR